MKFVFRIPNKILAFFRYVANVKLPTFVHTPGLSLRAGGRGFSPATTSLSPGYFDTKRKYSKEKNASNYKIMNLKKNKPIVY